MKNDILDLGLGKKIQNYRLNKKFTIKELAEKIGITSGLPESNEVRYELLTPDTKGSIEFCLMYIPNNTATEEFNQSHQGEEVAFVLKGTVEVIIEDREYILEEGCKQATLDKNCHFIDDENSKTLFLGYTVAALRLQEQLNKKNITINSENPLFVYLPCGVGGGPGGVMFGLKSIFGDNAHCFFAEPTHSPCMTLGLATNLHDKICVQDFGIDNKTAADGLAVGRASSFVGKCIENLVSGSYTLSDEQMYIYLAQMAEKENIYLEPSALAGIKGIEWIEKNELGKKYLYEKGIKKENIIHIAWATGGNMVPEEIMNEYITKGKELLSLTENK